MVVIVELLILDLPVRKDWELVFITTFEFGFGYNNRLLFYSDSLESEESSDEDSSSVEEISYFLFFFFLTGFGFGAAFGV